MTESHITIRLANASDIDALADLLGILFSQEQEFKVDRIRQTHSLKRIIAEPQLGQIFCAVSSQEVGATVIGMCSLLWSESTALGGLVAMLEDMVVNPAHQSKGVGSALLAAATKFAKGLGCKRITLLSDSHNQGAHALYRSHGFTYSSMVAFRLLLD